MTLAPTPNKLITCTRPLLAAALIAGGLCQLVAPAIAADTPVITNQATATYEDPDDPNVLLNAISNPVTIQVAEVAGITITQKGFTDAQGNAPSTIGAGNIVYFRFDVKNIGNDGTKFFIPNTAGIAGAATFQTVQYFDGTTWQDVPQAGFTSGNVAKDGVLPVRVGAKVNDGASGDITVSLGKTAQPNLQNQERNNPGDAADVYTIDNADKANPEEIDGAPTNGTREAMASQTVTIGVQTQAFATLKTTSGGYISSTNNVSYDLNLAVLSTPPTGAGNVQAADLVGTNIPGWGQGILISNAIPVGAQFLSATAPNGWQLVYLYGNAIAATDRADTSTWSTTPPTGQEILRRVGYFLPNGRIAKGMTVSGFNLKVTVLNPLTTTEIDNISQVFGATAANPSDPNDKTPNLNRRVFDESGDPNPNNFGDDGQPGAVDANSQPLVGPGIVDPNTTVDDPRNPNQIVKDSKGDNSGQGRDGEYLSTSINPTGANAILNGPNNNPAAQGPTDNNDDFIAKTTPVPAGIKKGDDLDPAPIAILNVVQNVTNVVSDIKVLPQPKTGETLPEGTKVTLKKDVNDPGVSFTLKNGQFVPDDPSKPVFVLSSVVSKTNRNYITTIDLPPGTKAVQSYPVQLLAFFDLNGNDRPDPTEPYNKTIDRLYTGSIDLLKESRILDASRQPVSGTNGQFSPTNKTSQPGQFIEYRIKFKNIAEAPAANSGTPGMTATNFQIIEDGNAPPNNWASTTENVPKSATVTVGSLEFAPVNDTNSLDVTKYVHKVGTLAPQAEGQFTFIRKVK